MKSEVFPQREKGRKERHRESAKYNGDRLKKIARGERQKRGSQNEDQQVILEIHPLPRNVPFPPAGNHPAPRVKTEAHRADPPAKIPPQERGDEYAESRNEENHQLERGKEAHEGSERREHKEDVERNNTLHGIGGQEKHIDKQQEEKQLRNFSHSMHILSETSAQ
jgi:hypothetical protein